METCDYRAPWYHGSPERLTRLRSGSWVTQLREMAKAFSHKPSLLSLDDDCNHVMHDGKLPGYLYAVSEPVRPEDVCCLRHTAQTHWQTTRDLQVRLVCELAVDDPPQLTPEKIAALRGILPAGSTGMVCAPGAEED